MKNKTKRNKIKTKNAKKKFVSANKTSKKHYSNSKVKSYSKSNDLNLEVGATIVGNFINSSKKSKIKGRLIYGRILPKFNTKLENVYVIKEPRTIPEKSEILASKVVSINNGNIYVEITEIIGSVNDPSVLSEALIKEYNWPVDFREKTLLQADNANKPVTPADKDGRTDFTEDLIITVDGDNTRDFDDAINVKYDGTNCILSVHIADVANYVQKGSALDKDAYARTTSVYLPDMTVPMLPLALSNGICSLNEGEERLTLSCIMTINEYGDVIDSKIVEGYINVYKRMTYNEVSYILDKSYNEFNSKKINFNNKLDNIIDTSELSNYDLKEYFDINLYSVELVEMINHAYALARMLKAKRVKQGAVDFDFPEAVVNLDSYSNPVGIEIEKRTIAHQIIEEFMLAANECVSKTYYDRSIPFLYRTHDNPKTDKLNDFIEFIKTTKYDFVKDKDDVKAIHYQKLLKDIKGEDDEKMISKMALRTMSQAVYSKDHTGHFALAKKDYSHFTSPIRRYPDLQIHRIIHDDLRGRLNEKKISEYNECLEKIALRCSEYERKAAEIERKSTDMKIAQYMQGFIYQTFEGTISSITGWGFYVELPNTAEGLVHVSSLKDDHYTFMEKEQSLIGSRTGKIFRLGDKVTVKLINVNIELGQLDFEFVTR